MRSSRSRTTRLSLPIAGLLLLAAEAPAEPIRFDEVTAASGIVRSGPSWGASWADFDGDGLPDLWLSNHGSTPSLYRNLGDGRFRNVVLQTVDALTGDQHGAAWADFDNDGDPDLLQLVGADSGLGDGPNRLWVNEGGALRDRAAELGLAYPLGRGRSPLWLDWNLDGRLDVLVVNAERPDRLAPTALFTQGAGTFHPSNDWAGVAAGGDGRFARVARVPGDPIRLLLLANHDPFPERAYRLDRLPFGDLRADLGFATGLREVHDAAIADLDGDLDQDIVLVRREEGSMTDLVAAGRLHASIVASHNARGIRFRAPDTLTFRVDPPWHLTASDVWIGSAATHPAERVFTVTADAAAGSPAFTPGSSFGVFIGHDPAAGTWRVDFSSPAWRRLDLVVETTGRISDVATIGFARSDGALPARVFLSERRAAPIKSRDPRRPAAPGWRAAFQDASARSGLGVPAACGSVVAGDFDNDMDVDLYLVCAGTVANLPNRLYENRGRGSFRTVPSAGGAAGSALGRGESATTVDHDGDGFLDLLVTNGLGNSPFNGGPVQLFRNRGNAHHWLAVDLEGVESNRDGLGARVVVTAGGVRQVRDADGGMHARAQNHARLHFGLRDERRVTHLRVEWPSGIVQEVEDLPADQVLQVLEPSAPSPLGRPPYEPGLDSGLFLWRGAADGPWHVRVSGDGSAGEIVVGILSEVAFGDVRPIDLEAGDELSREGNLVRLVSRPWAGEDGFDVDLPPGAPALFFVERDPTLDPRRLHVGGAGRPLTPAGWVLRPSTLPALPAFDPGGDLGLFLGWDASGGSLVARVNGDGRSHRAGLRIVAPTPFAAWSADGADVGSAPAVGPATLALATAVEDWWSGLSAAVPPNALVAVLFELDGLFQPRRVNPRGGGPGAPNAYRLP